MTKQQKKALKGMARKVLSAICWVIIVLLIPVLEIMYLSSKIIESTEDHEQN